MALPSRFWPTAALLLAAGIAPAADPISADVCVYGGTSGGVAAAVQARRMGKAVVLIEPGRHLGGMMAGGLSWTDIGSADRADCFGGLSREVFERIGARYGQDPKTVFDVSAPDTGDRSRKGIDFLRPPSLAFEPKVAEAVFTDLAREAGVGVHLGKRLKAVTKDGPRVLRLVADDGTAFAARVFIDATYEGDLLAAAGVSYSVGREVNSQYNETGNGVRGPNHGPANGRFVVPVDPFVRPGNPASGLLPLIHGDAPESLGSADKRVQSYNFRVCLTDNPANRVPIAPPANYDPARYELLGRYPRAPAESGTKLTLRSFCKYDPLPNRKYDFNNRGPISTDFLGGADGWPEADAAGRTRIAREHEDYLRGVFHFLATDPRVPANVRAEMGRFGLPRDEFPDTGHWPHQLYVREARRMVSDLVMTEHHVRNKQVAPDPVGLATYGMDIHAVRRVYRNGKLYNEGFGEGGGSPAPVGYQAIVPKAGECDNLFVPFALTASHAAFGSIRMEPVFMVLGQPAATAAVIAVDARVPVQKVDFPKLRARLLADGQVLGWPVKAGRAAPAAGEVDKFDLFQADTDGYAAYRIPGVVVTATGVVLAYCEARRTNGDWAAIDVMLRRSTDGGKTWGPRTHVAHFGPKVAKNPAARAVKSVKAEDATVNNPVMIADKTPGVVHFLYCVEYARCFYRRSDDDGQTFAAPVEVTAAFDAFRPEYAWTVIATGPGHGVQLKSGRLVVPVWLSTGTGGGGHRPSVAAAVYSDDGGKTWKRSEIALPNTPEFLNPSEAGVAELSDGRVVLNARTESKAHRRAVTVSPDGATGWTKPVFQPELVEPICMGSLTRAPGKPGGLLFGNPDNLAKGTGQPKEGAGRDRKNLTVQYSPDDGKTWPAKRVLEPGPSGYSDLAVAADGTVLCFYERGTTDGVPRTSTKSLCLARFPLSWVTGAGR